jgi:hypothetical protein
LRWAAIDSPVKERPAVCPVGHIISKTGLDATQRRRRQLRGARSISGDPIATGGIGARIEPVA